MFELFRRHHVLPDDYYRRPERAKIVLRAFIMKELELGPPPGKGG